MVSTKPESALQVTPGVGVDQTPSTGRSSFTYHPGAERIGSKVQIRMRRHLKTTLDKIHGRLDRMGNMLAVDKEGCADGAALARGILGFAIGVGAAEFGTEELKRIVNEGIEEVNASLHAARGTNN